MVESEGQAAGIDAAARPRITGGAKRRLEESRTVLQASFRTGLSGPSRLHDLFVTLEGVTPGEHRAGGGGLEARRTGRWGTTRKRAVLAWEAAGAG